MGARQCGFACGFLGSLSRKIPSNSFGRGREALFVHPSGEKPFRFDLNVEKAKTYSVFLIAKTVGRVVEIPCLLIDHLAI